MNWSGIQRTVKGHPWNIKGEWITGEREREGAAEVRGSLVPTQGRKERQAAGARVAEQKLPELLGRTGEVVR